ncbi:response regulator transcription factor [Luteimonas terrae]|uniref:DNA-binding response OmpR family regulator n=1 Tax=Luteimonas terrae TaxID=1530191 RepID=A0ABU1XUY3_9GAMM|nr:response regulator [Luteimonas terrae]MDR7192035.1 DNA-binding response OmpR family regulator [Luteimonas terrae]
MNEHAAPRVLVVEDEEDIAYILRFMFEREGFVVDHAADGREALARLEQDPPHGVVLDIMLPYHDGIEIVERLRAVPAWRTVPVLMLTAKAREVDIVRALDLGADDYVTKPFQPDEVVARMRRLLRRAA